MTRILTPTLALLLSSFIAQASTQCLRQSLDLPRFRRQRHNTRRHRQSLRRIGGSDGEKVMGRNEDRWIV